MKTNEVYQTFIVVTCITEYVVFQYLSILSNVLIFFLLNFVLCSPDKDTLNQYTKRMQFLKGFLNTKNIVIYILVTNKKNMWYKVHVST